MYEDYPDDYAHYYGVVTAMDRQVGRLNRAVQELGIENNTLVFFCSDNGPEGYGEYLRDRPGFRRSRGSSGGLRGRKRSLYNGGIAVPAVVKWPGRVSAGSTYDFPASTLDYLPTLIDHWSFQMPDDRPLDGESLIPLIDEAESGEVGRRRSTIPYRFVERRGAMFGSPTFAAIGNRFKLLTNLDADPDDLSQRQLFDLRADPYEEDNVIGFYPDEAEELQEFIESKMGSFKASHYGADYGEGSGGGFDAGSGGEEWEPTEPFLDVDRSWSGE
jgi:arylsulfatase A-like enzyme